MVEVDALALYSAWERYVGLPENDPPAVASAEGIVLEAGGLADAWDAAWDKATEGAEFAADDDVEALKASGARLAQKYLSEAVPAIEPAAVEVPVSGTNAGI